MKVYSFEKLQVWQLSRQYAKRIYQLSKQFPSEERFGLTSQIRRACISVSSNLAEGSARLSAKEQARFTEISFGSLLETLNQLILAADLEFIAEEEVNNIRPMVDEIGNKLNALRASQLSRVK